MLLSDIPSFVSWSLATSWVHSLEGRGWGSRDLGCACCSLLVARTCPRMGVPVFSPFLHLI